MAKQIQFKLKNKCFSWIC